jgi:CBS-domain-containing membrane protein
MFSGKVSDLPKKEAIVVLLESQTMTEALQTLFEKNILSAPVLDGQGHFLGQVDLMDAVVFLVYFSKKTQELLVALGLQPEDKQVNFGGLLPEDDDLKELFKVYESTASLTNFSHVNPTKTVSGEDSIEELANLLAVHHRVGVVDEAGKLVNYITQSDFVKYVAGQLGSSPDLDKPISALEIGSPHPVSVHESSIVVEALKYIVTKRVSSIAVVDSHGALVNEICPRDIRGINLETQFLDRLILPVSDYFNVLNKAALKTLTPENSLKDVITVFCEDKMHRVFVVQDKKAVRVISLGDLLRFLPK